MEKRKLEDERNEHGRNFERNLFKTLQHLIKEFKSIQRLGSVNVELFLAWLDLNTRPVYVQGAKSAFPVCCAETRKKLWVAKQLQVAPWVTPERVSGVRRVGERLEEWARREMRRLNLSCRGGI